MAFIWNGPHTSAMIPEAAVEEQSPSVEREGSNQTEPMAGIRGGKGRMEKGVPEHLGLEKGADRTETEPVLAHFII